MHNDEPLMKLLLENQDLLRSGVSEYKLMQHLAKQPASGLTSGHFTDELSLFQNHFKLFNALYQLRDRWLEQKAGLLSIRPLCIQLQPYEGGNEALTEADPLRAYYLEWQNYHQTGQQEVEQLLDDFWQRMSGQFTRTSATTQDVDEARTVFDFSHGQSFTRAEIKTRYRQLQHRHHPDKGGDTERAKKVVWAYEVLLSTL